jgi:hypothetical protein
MTDLKVVEKEEVNVHETAHSGFTDWASAAAASAYDISAKAIKNPYVDGAIALAAVAGVALVTRGKWAPLEEELTVLSTRGATKLSEITERTPSPFVIDTRGGGLSGILPTDVMARIRADAPPVRNDGDVVRILKEPGASGTSAFALKAGEQVEKVDLKTSIARLFEKPPER